MARGGARPNSGRKKGSKVRVTMADGRTLTEIARELTGDAVQTLVNIMRSLEAPPHARVTAANSLLDRGWGKPVSTHEITGKDGGPIEHANVSARDELVSRIDSILARQGANGSAAKPH